MERIDLRFSTVTEAVDALNACGLPNNGMPIAELVDGFPVMLYPQGAFCGNYGQIWRTVGEGESAQPEMLPGIHVTVLAEECPESLVHYRIFVNSPFVVI